VSVCIYYLPFQDHQAKKKPIFALCLVSSFFTCQFLSFTKKNTYFLLNLFITVIEAIGLVDFFEESNQVD